MTCLFCTLSGGRILGRNPNKSIKSLPPCSSQSALQLCLENSISSDSHNLLQFLLYTVKEKEGKPDRKPYPLSLWFKKSIQKAQERKNSQDYAQKPQRICTFMNSASGVARSCTKKGIHPALNTCTGAMLFCCAELCLTERDSITRFFL
jgi:hypothetical protein